MWCGQHCRRRCAIDCTTGCGCQRVSSRGLRRGGEDLEREVRFWVALFRCAGLCPVFKRTGGSLCAGDISIESRFCGSVSAVSVRQMFSGGASVRARNILSPTAENVTSKAITLTAIMPPRELRSMAIASEGITYGEVKCEGIAKCYVEIVGSAVGVRCVQSVSEVTAHHNHAEIHA